jgi:MFS family permease
MPEQPLPPPQGTIARLALVQALGGSSQSIIMTIGALSAVAMAPSSAIVTLPVTAMIVGLALATGPATMLVYRIGRQKGFMAGAAISVPAAIVAAIAVWLANFWLFSAGLFFVGTSAAFFQQIRFAAADSVPPEMKSRAISWVLFGGVAAGFFGPWLSGASRTWIPGVDYAAGYLVIAVLALASMTVLSRTRLAPVIRPGQGGAEGRPLGRMLRTPAVVLPMVTAAASYALMTLVMVAAPLAMVHVCGHPPEAATGAIQWHVVAMFGPSFITGSLIKRLGAPLVTAMGLLLILGCAAVALNGISVAHFYVALILLGVGWNFGFIGSTTLLTAAYSPEEAGRVQAVNEQIVFGTMALASIGSGVLLDTIGWEAINLLAMSVAVLAILLLAGLDLGRRFARPA